MIVKINAKKKALKLRGKGRSLNEISRIIGISKSTASLWCRGRKLSRAKIRELIIRGGGAKLGALANKIKRDKELRIIERNAINEIKKFKKKQTERLRDIGTIIYWAEGTKKNMVDITNSDPELIKIAMLWFRKVCKVPENRFRLSIFYHSGQKEDEIKKYWSKITGIPLSQFNKSIFKKEGTGHRKRILDNGTCKIRICDRNLLHRIKTWISRFYLT